MKCQQWLASASEQLKHSCGTYDLRADNSDERNDQNHHHNHNNNNNIENTRKPTESTAHATVISRDRRRSVPAQASAPFYEAGTDRMNSCSDLSGHLTDHSSGKSSTDEDMYGDSAAMRSQSVTEKARESSPTMMAGSSGATMLKSTDAAEIEAEKVLGT